jgi:hypothetical protein
MILGVDVKEMCQPRLREWQEPRWQRQNASRPARSGEGVLQILNQLLADIAAAVAKAQTSAREPQARWRTEDAAEKHYHAEFMARMEKLQAEQLELRETAAADSAEWKATSERLREEAARIAAKLRRPSDGA